MKTVLILMTSLLLGAPLSLAAGEQDKKTTDDTGMQDPTTKSMEDTEVTEDASQVMEETVVSFTAGSSVLTETAKNDIRNLIDRAKTQGEIEKVSVAVWADQSFPPDETAAQDVRNQAGTLADERSQSVQQALNDVDQDLDLTTYNMARDAGFVARLFNTDEAELKSLFARERDETEPADKGDKTEKVLHSIKNNGGPSKAVVIAQIKPKSEQQPSATNQKDDLQPETAPQPDAGSQPEPGPETAPDTNPETVP